LGSTEFLFEDIKTGCKGFNLEAENEDESIIYTI